VNLKARWGVDPVAVELYDHRNDGLLAGFGTETNNTVNATANRVLRKQLAGLVRELFDLAPE
jgi:hypothetical protein